MAETPAVSYAPTEEQELIRSTAREYLERNLDLETVRDQMMSGSGFDTHVWKEMADLGWTGLAISEKHGGAGLGHVEMGVLLEEMGRLVTPGPFFASAVMATIAIQEMASPQQQAELLPLLATGEKIATLAIFEQPLGWAEGRPATSAVRTGSGWRLDGTKRAVLAGSSADLILVSASTDEGVEVFVVEAAGVDISEEPVLDLTRRQSVVMLHSVAVEDSARLGAGTAEGLRRTLDLATVALASEQVGGAQRCMEMSVDYAKSRFQFGRPIGSYQAIKHRCAGMLMKVEHARSAVHHATRITNDPEELAIAAPLAGSLAPDAYTWVAGENIQVHGGVGFTWEHDAHLYLKRARASSLLLGSPRHQRSLLATALGL